MNAIAIINGRLIDPASQLDQVSNLYIQDGKIAAIGSAPDGFVAETEIDASHHIVIPGAIDLNARLREPGQEHKGTIISETCAAARGGIATAICQPDTIPVIDTPALAELIRRRARQSAHARVLTIGALTVGLAGQQLTEMAALQRSGCVAVSNARRPLANNLILRRAMEYAASWQLPLFFSPLEHSLINNGCVHEGQISSRLGLPAIPSSAESIAVATAIELAQQTKVSLHIQSISSARSVDIISQAQARNLTVSADVAAHQLFLSEQDVETFDGNTHVIPPLRNHTDRDALRQGIKDGTICAVTSQHEPHEADAKMAPFPETEAGISAFETLLPLTFRLVEEGLIDYNRAVECLTSGPAAVARLPYGRLKVGVEADIAVIDPQSNWRFSREQMISMGRNNPFDGWLFNHSVKLMLFKGKVTWSDEH